MNQSKSTRFTFYVNRIVFAGIVALLFLEPRILEFYCRYRYLSENEQLSITGAFYFCAAAALVALWHLDRLLGNILNNQVFTSENVARIRWVRRCCALVSLFCVAPSLYYPPMIFLVVIMGFLCLVVNVVCQVMKAAVSIREENDLTI